MSFEEIILICILVPAAFAASFASTAQRVLGKRMLGMTLSVTAVVIWTVIISMLLN